MPTNGSDDFNRADGGLGANWTVQASTFTGAIVSTRVRSSGGSVEMQFTAITPGNDQSARILIPTYTGPADSDIGVILRAQTPGSRSFYAFTAGAGASPGSAIYQRNAGSYTALITEGTTAWASGDGLEGRAVGNVLSLYRYAGNLDPATLILTYTDTSTGGNALFLSGGVGIRLGLGTGGTAGQNELDNFAAGTYPAPAVGVVAQAMVGYARRRRP